MKFSCLPSGLARRWLGVFVLYFFVFLNLASTDTTFAFFAEDALLMLSKEMFGQMTKEEEKREMAEKRRQELREKAEARHKVCKRVHRLSNTYVLILHTNYFLFTGGYWGQESQTADAYYP